MHRKEVSIIHITIAQGIADRVNNSGEIDVESINTILKGIYRTPNNLCMKYIRELVNDGLLIPNSKKCWRTFTIKAGLIKGRCII
jgi:hypothetical protein